jgi:hypothetical protein
MRSGLRRLVVTSIIIALMIAGVLLLLFVPGLRGRWMEPHEYWMWDRARLANPWNLLASVMIALLMLAIPLAHIAWLVVAAIWLARSAELPPVEEALNCPRCDATVRSDWKVCPHCGEKLEAARDEK